MTLLKCFFAILFLIYNFPCQSQEVGYYHGTTELVYLQGDTIWMAADTRGNSEGKDPIKVKKIYKVDNVFFAIAGLDAIYNKKTGKVIFDIPNMVQQLIRTYHDNFDIIFDRFIDSCSRRLSYVCNLKQRNPAAAVDIRIDLTLMKMQSAKPVINICTININGLSQNCKIEVEPIDTIKKDGSLVMLGRYEYPGNYIYNNPNYFEGQTKIKERLICLIKMAADKDSLVGLPVEVLMLHKNGHKFYRNNYKCHIKD